MSYLDGIYATVRYYWSYYQWSYYHDYEVILFWFLHHYMMPTVFADSANRNMCRVVIVPRIDKSDQLNLTVPIKDRAIRGVPHPPLLEEINATFHLQMHISRVLLTLPPFSAIALAIPLNPGAGAVYFNRDFSNLT